MRNLRCLKDQPTTTATNKKLKHCSNSHPNSIILHCNQQVHRIAMKVQDNKPIDATSAAMLNSLPYIDVKREQSTVPSPPPIKRVVRWHNDIVGRSYDPEDSLAAPQALQLNSRMDHLTNLSPRPVETSLEYIQPSLNVPQFQSQNQFTSVHHASAIYGEYYSMGGHSLELQEEEPPSSSETFIDTLCSFFSVCS